MKGVEEASFGNILRRLTYHDETHLMAGEAALLRNGIFMVLVLVLASRGSSCGSSHSCYINN